MTPSEAASAIVGLNEKSQVGNVEDTVKSEHLAQDRDEFRLTFALPPNAINRLKSMSVNDVLTKPVRTDELLQALDRLSGEIRQ